MSEPTERLRLNLPDPLASDAHLPANFLKGV